MPLNRKRENTCFEIVDFGPMRDLAVEVEHNELNFLHLKKSSKDLNRYNKIIRPIFTGTKLKRLRSEYEIRMPPLKDKLKVMGL